MTPRRLPVVLTRRAEAQILSADEWWHANRAGAPGAIREDLVIALDLIAANPGVGAPARAMRLKGIRRVFLRRVGYFLYYRVARQAHEIQVLSFWHASRETGPAL